MRRSWLFALSAASVALGACSLVTSLDGLSSGGVTGDGGATSPGADAAADAPRPTDDAGRIDAGPDATFCQTFATPPTLCADFDTADVPAPFSEIVRSGSGSKVERDGAEFVSRPFSLLLVDGLTGGTSAAALRKTLKGASTSVTIELDFRYDVAASAEAFDLVQFTKDDYEIGVEIRPNGDVVFDREVPNGDGGTIESKIPVGKATLGQWAHLSWSAKPDGSGTWTITATVGGQSGSAAINARVFTEDSNFAVGDETNLASAAPAQWRVHVDDVVVRVQ